jgi:hypothetical protein
MGVLVSNRAYRLGQLVGSGTRPRPDDGRLGVAVMESGHWVPAGIWPARRRIARIARVALRGSR